MRQWGVRWKGSLPGGRLGRAGHQESIVHQTGGAVHYRVETRMLSDIGRQRSSNQDSFAFICPGDLLQRQRRGVLTVIADGMGGHNGGEVASALAVETICQNYFATPGDDPGTALVAAMREANRTIIRATEAEPALAGMGTTATALVLVGELVVFAHVGDSRLYRCLDGRCSQLSEDQTVAAEMVRSGLLSVAQARHHPARNVLLSSLGTAHRLRVVAQHCAPPVIGERFVLCSDGLWESVDGEEMAAIVGRQAPAMACRRLVELALERDGSDNISLAIVSIEPAAVDHDPASEPPAVSDAAG
ncbi:MAG: serine/threonine-protein phosphatase [Candidatus Accumulibacter sp.]|uniref:PP2C family protein-serine/threonine phosphatase n=1 Tax=Accumulibacter sp. TaxID=2053492 RepID=UPI001A4689CC|nr:protein phosphatase 2C domain-containing protein [Accumulibacter sp.]MBL8395520.1 serine/threonine-protein phosphatase [Accumulibacter sp.]